MTGPDLPSWQIDELAFAGDEHLDAAYVEVYDRKAGFDPGPEVELVRGLGLDRHSTVIDYGAGTGAFAVAVAPHCARVVALDVSPAMVGVLAGRAARAGLGNVEAVRRGFLTYEHEGEPADFAFSRNALHHLPDFWKAVALRRVASALRPGGVLRLRDLAYSFAPHEADSALGAWLAAAPLRPEDGWTREELATHVRDEHSTFTWLLEPMLERAGFEVRSAEYSRSRVFAQWTCVRGAG